MSLLLILASALQMPVIFSAGLAFPDAEKTDVLVGSIYTGNIEFQVFRVNEAFFGVTGNFFVKRSVPYENEYFKDPAGNISLFCGGIGPAFAWSPRRSIRVELQYTLNYLTVRYPEPASNSRVITASSNHVAAGIEMVLDFIPFSLGNCGLGVRGGLNVLGYSDYYYYYDGDYKAFDQLSISGMMLEILIARW